MLRAFAPSVKSEQGRVKSNRSFIIRELPRLDIEQHTGPTPMQCPGVYLNI